jgi:hypothetical protein
MKLCPRCAGHVADEVAICPLCEAPQSARDEDTSFRAPAQVGESVLSADHSPTMRFFRIGFRLGVALVSIPSLIYSLLSAVEADNVATKLIGALVALGVSEAVVRGSRVGLRIGVVVVLIVGAVGTILSVIDGLRPMLELLGEAGLFGLMALVCGGFCSFVFGLFATIFVELFRSKR